ncbi:MAG: hypothetical protein JWO41_211 [Candidatus Saccharibacteria bacterium]|nr:hypothetical protein [Candidatus Saccharibacteria bacterium]
MDFSRSAQPQAAAPAAAVGHSKKSGSDKSPLARAAVVAAAALVGLLLIALAVVSFGGDTDKESKFVNSDKLQAVFLNTGQVYFGKITELNSKYFVVTNIYYLQTSTSGSTTTNSSTSVSLVKLGCELHEPYDKMVINRSQVTFWENLQDNGQVAKAVSTFQKQNPNGQKCSDQGASASGSTTNSVQNAGTANTSTGTKQ